MRVFKIKGFARFQRKEHLSDAALAKAMEATESGLIDADLGSGLIKQRVARSGEGKRGGYRTVIAYKKYDRAIFLFGYAKNAQANLTPDELVVLAKIGTQWLRADENEIAKALAEHKLMEMKYDETT